MGSSAVLDIDRLVAPIPGDNPSGVDLRRAGREFIDAIRGARKQARDAEKLQMQSGGAGPQPAEWRTVFDKCREALATRTKDLELLSYLLESAVRLQGFAGLRDGFKVTRLVVESFWDNLYPPADELDIRLAGLVQLNGQELKEGMLIPPIYRVPLTRGKTARLSRFDYQLAAALEQLPAEKRDEKVKLGQVNVQAFERAVAETPTQFYRDLADDIAACLSEFEQLCALLDTKAGLDNSPPTSKIREALKACQDLVNQLAGPRIAPADAPANESPVSSDDAGVDEAGGGPASAAIPRTFRTRDEAFDTILRVAQYFRENEPQSLVIYALEQAVNWGKMSAPDLLTFLITDESARGHLFQMVGIKPPETNGNG